MPPSPQDDDRGVRLLAAFRHAASDMPWYRTLLDEAGVDPGEIADAASFASRVPILTKQNTFDRFPIDQLAATTPIRELAGVLTSSGHGGRFSFGLTTRGDAAIGPAFVDGSLDAAFSVKSRPTLAINCLPMGVGFGSACMTVATTSVREDMALALVKTFGSHYEQVVLVGDPLFMKRFTDYAASLAFDWRRYRINIVMGEEIFGERFRDYLAARVGLDVTRPERGYIMSSFGVGELGLHLGYETVATIALRRAAMAHPDFVMDLLGCEPASGSVPMLLAFNPARTWVESIGPDAAGYGRFTVSMLDPELAIPLLRYQTGDLARVLDLGTVAAVCRRHGLTLPADLPPTLVALRGRLKERLPNGADVGLYKDALYDDHEAARHLSGAFKIAVDSSETTWHVQRTQLPPASVLTDAELTSRILRALAAPVRPTVIVWPYDRFPFGMSVDYERKFAYVDAP